MKVLDKMKEAFSALGLPVLNEHREGRFPCLESEVRYGEYIMHILALHDPDEEMILVSITFSLAAPPENRKTVIELVNLINHYLDTSHYFVCPRTGKIILKFGLFTANGTLNREQFLRFVQKLLGDGHLFYPLICEQVYSEKTPEVLITRFLNANRDLWK
jgi:hypothetical protein